MNDKTEKFEQKFGLRMELLKAFVLSYCACSCCVTAILPLIVVLMTEREGSLDINTGYPTEATLSASTQ